MFHRSVPSSRGSPGKINKLSSSVKDDVEHSNNASLTNRAAADGISKYDTRKGTGWKRISKYWIRWAKSYYYQSDARTLLLTVAVFLVVIGLAKASFHAIFQKPRVVYRFEFYPRFVCVSDDNAHDDPIYNQNLTVDCSSTMTNGIASRMSTRSIVEHWGERDEKKSKKYDVVGMFFQKGCVEQFDWQVRSFPNCNNVHEISLVDFDFDDTAGEGRIRILGNGHYRDVWEVSSLYHYNSTTTTVTTESVALKTLRYTHPFDVRNYDRHRRDALSMDRLTASPHILDIYGYCANSGLYRYGSQGDLEDVIWPRGRHEVAISMTPLRKLRVARQVARAIADVHVLPAGRKGLATIAHTDIAPKQFILVDGAYQLNDFNRARLMGWNPKLKKQCGYKVAKNGGKFRSPEEYRYDTQDEKVDIYSMGNIFYGLLTGMSPFDKVKAKKAYEMVMERKRPFVPDYIMKSPDLADQALLHVMKRCHVHDPAERASATEIVDYLTQQLDLMETDADALA